MLTETTLQGRGKTLQGVYRLGTKSKAANTVSGNEGALATRVNHSPVDRRKELKMRRNPNELANKKLVIEGVCRLNKKKGRGEKRGSKSQTDSETRQGEKKTSSKGLLGGECGKGEKVTEGGRRVR